MRTPDDIQETIRMTVHEAADIEKERMRLGKLRADYPPSQAVFQHLDDLYKELSAAIGSDVSEPPDPDVWWEPTQEVVVIAQDHAPDGGPIVRENRIHMTLAQTRAVIAALQETLDA